MATFVAALVVFGLVTAAMALGVIVQGNRVGRNQRNGVKLWAGGRMANNLVWDSGDTAIVLEGGTFTLVNNTVANLEGYNYLAMLGNYDAVHAASVSLYNNIFSKSHCCWYLP